MAELKSCNNVVFFEARKGEDLCADVYDSDVVMTIYIEYMQTYREYMHEYLHDVYVVMWPGRARIRAPA